MQCIVFFSERVVNAWNSYSSW